MTHTPEYTYYAFNLVNGAVIGTLPLRGAQPQWAVNDPGELGGPTINLDGLSSIRRADVRAGSVPYKCGIAVDRSGTIIWSGIITGRRYDSRQGAYSLTVPGLLAYWRRRVIGANLTFEDVDQHDIVATLLLHGGAPTVPVGIVDPASGVIRDRTIAGSELRSALDEIMELADNINGYELALDSFRDPLPGAQRVLHRLRIGSPRLGRTEAAGDLLLLEWPGNVRDYTWDEDGSEFATTVYGASTTDEGVTVVRFGTNTTLLSVGFPQVMETRQWSNITNTATLDGHIVQALAEANGYLDAPSFTVPDSGDTAAGSWVVGDDVRIRISDDRRFPVPSGALGPGLDLTVRIQAATLDPVAGSLSLTAFGFTEAVQ